MKKITAWYLPAILAATVVAVGCSKSEPKATNEEQKSTTSQDAAGDKNKGDAASPTSGSDPKNAVSNDPNAGSNPPAVDVKTDGNKPSSDHAAATPGLGGHYSGTMHLPDSVKKDPQAAMAEAMMKNISLDLKDDKSFSMTMVFPIEGHWTVSGDIVSLNIEKMMGMDKAQLKDMANKQRPGAVKSNDMDKPMKLKISDGGKTLTAIDDTGGSKGQLIFKK